MSNPRERHPAIEKYLAELEVAAKQCVGVHPNQILRDAEEHLIRDCDALLRVEPGLDEESVLNHFRQSFGEPNEVAKSYEQFSDTRPSAIPATAPGWRIYCPRCGKSAPAKQRGITRIGAWSFGKRVLGWCSECNRLRWLKLTQDLEKSGTITPSEGATASAKSDLKRHAASLIQSRFWALARLSSVRSLALALIFFLVSTTQAAQKQAASKAPGLQTAPAGWTIVRESEVTGAQLGQFSKKLGIELASLFNTVVAFEKKELQINTITAKNEADAEQLKSLLRKGKSNSRWVVQNRASVYEFVARSSDEARVASIARYAFAIEPTERSYHVTFEAIPILSEESGLAPDARNRMFNLLLELPTKPSLSKDVAELAKKFKFAPEINLVKNLQGQVTADWTAEPVDGSSPKSDSEVANIKFPTTGSKLGMPSATLSAEFAIDTKQKRKADASVDKKSLMAANKRFPTDSPELQKLVGSIVGPNDSDSIKLRKLLDWLADSKNIKYDGLVGSRYGTILALKQRYGRCWDYSDAFITMARIAGLPSRQVYGWLFESEGHVWCDVIIDGHWQMVDPTTGTVCGSDYIPICVSAAGEFPIVYASKVSIEVKK